MMIYGNLICQNGIAEIARCIESVFPIVDEYLVMDGGSTDGTWEWLKKWKDVYHLTLFRHPYKDQGKQRNLLLSKTPKNVWVVNIDQDEQLTSDIQYGLRDLISKINPSEFYTNPKRELILNIGAYNINLVKDICHFDANKVQIFRTKIFYNDRDLCFTSGYHTTNCYKSMGDVPHSNCLNPPQGWLIKHYAYLDPKRIKNSWKDKKRLYRKDEWDEKNWKIAEILP